MAPIGLKTFQYDLAGNSQEPIWYQTMIQIFTFGYYVQCFSGTSQFAVPHMVNKFQVIEVWYILSKYRSYHLANFLSFKSALEKKIGLFYYNDNSIWKV